MGTNHHSINIARVRKRVEEGGHDVPQDEIVRRWNATWANLLKTWDRFDHITIFDNSATEPKAVLEKRTESTNRRRFPFVGPQGTCTNRAGHLEGGPESMMIATVKHVVRTRSEA